MCYGLRSDFMLNGFTGSSKILLLAEDIQEIKSMCSCDECKNKATLNMRRVNGIPTFEGESVLIDGSQADVTYEGVCGECYTRIRKRGLTKN